MNKICITCSIANYKQDSLVRIPEYRESLQGIKAGDTHGRKYPSGYTVVMHGCHSWLCLFFHDRADSNRCLAMAFQIILIEFIVSVVYV